MPRTDKWPACNVAVIMPSHDACSNNFESLYPRPVRSYAPVRFPEHAPSMAEVWQDIVATDGSARQMQQYAEQLQADGSNATGVALDSALNNLISEGQDSERKPPSSTGKIRFGTESGSQSQHGSISGSGLQSSSRSMDDRTDDVHHQETTPVPATASPVAPDTYHRRCSTSRHGVSYTRNSLTRKSLQMSQSFKEHRSFALDSFIDSARLGKVCDLGSGAYAHVEWAIWKQPNDQYKNVAVKRLKSHLITSDQELHEFVSEGQCLKQLYHPSIVEFVGLGFRSNELSDAVEHDSMFIVQELMNSGTLKLKVLDQMVPSSDDSRVYTFCDALRWMIQLAQGLAYLHGLPHKIIHRDLKLENVLLSEDQDGVLNAKLADFGLHAIIMANELDSTVQRIKSMTRSTAESNSGGGGDPTFATSATPPAPAASQSSTTGSVQRLDTMLRVSGPHSARIPSNTFRSAISRTVSAGVVARSSAAEAPAATGIRRSVSEIHPSLRDRWRGVLESAKHPSTSPAQNAAATNRSEAQVADTSVPGDSTAAGRPLMSLQRRGSLRWRDDSQSANWRPAETGERPPAAPLPAPTPAAIPPVAGADCSGARSGSNERVAGVAGQEATDFQTRDLTGQTGSYLYMAPEVMRNSSYDEKADIFSMSQVMFEVFAKSVTSAAILTTGSIEECEMYAWKVAEGYRRPVPTWWPPPMARLVIEASSANPDARPSAQEIVVRLMEMSLSGVVATMDGVRSNDNTTERTPSNTTCCCTQ